MRCPYCGKPATKIDETETVITYECTNENCESKDFPIHIMK